MARNLKSGFKIIFYTTKHYPLMMVRTSLCECASQTRTWSLCADVRRVKLKAKLDIIITFKLIIESWSRARQWGSLEKATAAAAALLRSEMKLSPQRKFAYWAARYRRWIYNHSSIIARRVIVNYHLLFMLNTLQTALMDPHTLHRTWALAAQKLWRYAAGERAHKHTAQFKINPFI